jgi:uncharacterized protein YbaR (Trm112 family)
MDDSIAMRWCRRAGFESLAWSLRRLHCPVGRNALVLEVGSGGNPCYRANVLLDAFEATRQRHWVPLVAERPTVLGIVERLPFKDKAFDFVIASHVFEHSTDPVGFLSELQRVARAGYIEVPDAFMERVNPYRDHRLEVTLRDGVLLIRKKRGWQHDPELVELYEHRAKSVITSETMRRHPFQFHVRYYWSDKIDFRIIGEDYGSFPVNPEGERQAAPLSMRQKIKGKLLSLARAVLSQRKRNAALDLRNLLQCPDCRDELSGIDLQRLHCTPCGRIFPASSGIPVLFPELLGAAK